VNFEDAKEFLKHVVDESDNFNDVLWAILFSSFLDNPDAVKKCIELCNSQPSNYDTFQNYTTS